LAPVENPNESRRKAKYDEAVQTNARNDSAQATNENRVVVVVLDQLMIEPGYSQAVSERIKECHEAMKKRMAVRDD
jgi:hypothetical protein